jgi:DNA polymerase-3 subunit beta
MVATDGHRLAMVDRLVPEGKLERGVVMPRKGLGEVRKLLEGMEEGELTLLVSPKDVRIAMPAVSFFMRLVEGEFPDYRQVIPASTRIQVRANRDDFLAALRRTALLASERSRGVKLSLTRGRLEISASNPDQGEASEDIEVAYQGEPVTVGFNARYLIDVLTVHAEGDVIELALTDEVGPGVLKGSQDPDFTYVVMPMRL